MNYCYPLIHLIDHRSGPPAYLKGYEIVENLILKGNLKFFLTPMNTNQVMLSLPPLDLKLEYFPDWCLQMRVILRSNDCLIASRDNHPDATDHQDEELYDALFSKYKLRKSKAMELVFRHLSLYAFNFVQEAESVKEVWQILKTNFEDKSAANQLHLFDKLLRLKMAAKEDITWHFAKFDGIINKRRASSVTAIDNKQFLVSILLCSMSSDYLIARTAIAMTAKEELKIESVKGKLQIHSLTIEPLSKPNLSALIDAKTNDQTSKTNFRGRGRGHDCY